MFEPMPRPLAVSLTLACFALAQTSCERETAPPAAPTATAPAPLPVAAQPVVIDRAGLLVALDRAASAYSSGSPAPVDDSLAGRRFVIRTSFACGGEEPAEGAPASASTDQHNERSQEGVGQRKRDSANNLTLSLTPSDWTDTPLVGGAGTTWEAVEGFWLPYPWMRAEGCPQWSSEPLPSFLEGASYQTSGLAAVFDADSSRLTRRNGRAYEHTLRSVGDEPASAIAGGFRVVLEGRFTAFANGAAILCHSDAPDRHPVCIAAAELDRVSFEDAEGQLLSAWGRG